MSYIIYNQLYALQVDLDRHYETSYVNKKNEEFGNSLNVVAEPFLGNGKHAQAESFALHFTR